VERQISTASGTDPGNENPARKAALAPGNQLVYEYAETTGAIWVMELK
jgi:hypothetical protein